MQRRPIAYAALDQRIDIAADPAGTARLLPGERTSRRKAIARRDLAEARKKSRRLLAGTGRCIATAIRGKRSSVAPAAFLLRMGRSPHAPHCRHRSRAHTGRDTPGASSAEATERRFRTNRGSVTHPIRENRNMTRPPEQADAGDDALAACNRAIESIRAKADNNERLARWSTGAIVMSSALIPLSIVASASGHPFVWGKLVPAALAVVSAVAAGLLQFERPHERWKLYRGYQRQLEDERFRHHNAIAPYTRADEEQRMRLLGERVSAINARLHDTWSGLVQGRVDALSQAPGDPP